MDYLPSGFAFDTIAKHQLASQANAIGLFEFEGAGFVLLPGGEIQLGFDASLWEPMPEERESWKHTAEEYGLPPDPAEYVARVTRPPFVVEMPALLVETQANEVGWTRISNDDPIAQKMIAELPDAGKVATHLGDDTVRVRRDPDGGVTCERYSALNHEDVASALAPFRLPTSDEWEYACGGGATSLFRWGDHVPCDRYPTDLSPEEAAWRRQWALSGGKLDYPEKGFQSDWSFHTQPNACGLCIASNPYHWELTAEPDWVRGGDGGCSICGGAGFFMGWIPLATSYCDEDFCRPEEPIDPGYTYCRRVFQT
ncbi:MAG: SUMF1/EgtB/PvdO family nonheme iron enzyme [Planctomycetales bacterium]